MSLIQQFATLPAQVAVIAREELVSRFRRLGADEIFVKRGADGNQETVTVADRLAEQRLTPVLTAICPGSVVVGEEAAAANPELLEKVRTEPLVWVVDPLDGTENFARGIDDFGVMAALVRDGEIVYSLIHLPTRSETYVAEQGCGVQLNGEPLQRSYQAGEVLRGTFHVHYAPERLARAADAVLESGALVRAPGGSAATEYVAVARGEKDFIQYYRLMPWDHCPGALIVREMGGAVRDFDGRDYRAVERDAFTFVGASEAAWTATVERVRAVLAASES